MSSKRHILTPTLWRILAVGALSVLAIILVDRVRYRDRRSACTRNLTQIGLASKMILHGRIFPDPKTVPKSYYDKPQNLPKGYQHMQPLIDGGWLDEPEIFVCPAGEETPAVRTPAGGFILGPGTCSYSFALGGMMRTSPETLPLAACHCPHGGLGVERGRNVLFLSGDVIFVPEEQFRREFSARLTSR